MLFECNFKHPVDYKSKEFSINEKISKSELKTLTEHPQYKEKVIPNDKVNRQLFESEVQLLNALNSIKFKDRISKKQEIVNFIPKSGIKSISTEAENFEICCDLDLLGVTYLPDHIISAKSNSKLIPQIIESRQLKFHKIFSDFQHVLGSINKKHEDKVSQLCQILINNLDESNENIKNSLFVSDSTKIINNLTHEDFENLEFQLKNSFLAQRHLIENFYQDILQIESDKINNIRSQASRFSNELEKIGHVAPSEVHRIINTILIDINLALVDNKEVFKDLKTKLLMSVINEDRKSQLYISNYRTMWQKTITNSYLSEIRIKIENETSHTPETIACCKVNLDDTVLKLSTKIQDVSVEIKNKMNPELANEEKIKNWIHLLKNICEEFGITCDFFMNTAYGKFEQINQSYLSEFESLKSDILTRRIYDNEIECSNIIDSFCLPLLNNMHLNFEQTLHKIEIFIEEKRDSLEKNVKKIESFLNDLWNLWKVHESDLKINEENIFSKLNASSVRHQEQNLVTENELNVIIDKIRQGSSETILKEDFKKSLNQLDKIKSNYNNFYNQQVNLLKQFTSLVENDVKNFESRIKDYFIDFYDSKHLIPEDIDKSEALNSENPCDNNFSNSECFPLIKLITVEVSENLMNDLVKGVENNYINFIQKWYKTVFMNATKLITVKNEELSCELKLRCHLHEPRYKRIEFDVYNVRLTELLIHSERVNKHCKGIESSLNHIIEDYSTLDKELKIKQEKFKEKLSADEKNYFNCTDNSRLLNVGKMLEDRNKEYMEDIRLSIRNFQKSIENKLQKLRQSNANFICSFKLFSVGGNFCTEEIDNFTKVVEKTNKKIDDVEGEIMSNLEIIEKQQHDSVIQFQMLFEEKFKYHVVDITFMEKIKRALHNIQLKIKTEVTNSNSHSRIIYENINNLKKQFKNNSKLGKEEKMIFKSAILKDIYICFNDIQDRCKYLDCIKIQSRPKIKSNNIEDVNISSNNKVQFSAITALSKGGRQPNEDMGIKTVKNLLQCQNIYLLNSKLDDKILIDSRNCDKEAEKNSKTRDKNFPFSDNKLNSQKIANSRSVSAISESTSSGQKITSEKSKLVNKNQRLDKKYLMFDDDIPDNNVTFISKIRSFCKEILEGILFAAELYYRNKGMRKVTHSILPDSFDEAAEDIKVKLKFYFQQAEKYHSECLIEFNKQLMELENVMNLYPDIMFSNLFENIMAECVKSLDEANALQLEKFKTFSDQKTQNYAMLRSDFGHPSKENDLKNIFSNEASRQNQEKEYIIKSLENNNTIVYSYGRRFVQEISDLTEQSLLLLDNILTTDDIIIPDVKEEIVSATNLIRAQIREPMDSEVINSENELVLNKKTWFTNDMNDILLVDSTNKTLQDEYSSKCLISAKCTSCHSSIMNARCNTIKKFKDLYFGKLNHLQNVTKQRQKEMDSYVIFWNDSVRNLQNNFN